MTELFATSWKMTEKKCLPILNRSENNKKYINSYIDPFVDDLPNLE